ncbi:MAG: FAD:protein FMN transferase [bacterium]|nr:FAD:protein FMN transferase [bacterium]
MKKIVSVILLISLAFSALTGCSGGKDKEVSTTGFAFDTTYTITLLEGGSQELLNSCVQKCGEYEKIFSRTLESSQLYQINEIEDLYLKAVDAQGVYRKEKNKLAKDFLTEKEIQSIEQQINKEKSEKNEAQYRIQENGTAIFQVSDELAEIIKTGLAYAAQSDGAFDIGIEPVSSLWNFSEDEKVIPSKEKIAEALPYVDYKKISMNGNELTFQMPGMGIDLGGIAKGYIADALKQYLQEQGVSSGMINLGGNILCIGKKEKGQDFLIGIQQPFADRNETVAAVSVHDVSVVSSGIYERYLTDKDGKQYHHIINPKTGYSYDNDLMAVTIISDKSIDGDALSTTCFSMGKEKGLAYVNSLKGVYAMFITKDEKEWYSEGFSELLIEE